jgi:hypothetical protein
MYVYIRIYIFMHIYMYEYRNIYHTGTYMFDIYIYIHTGLAYVNAQFVNKGKAKGNKVNSSSVVNDEKQSYGAGIYM